MTDGETHGRRKMHHGVIDPHVAPCFAGSNSQIVKLITAIEIDVPVMALDSTEYNLSIQVNFRRLTRSV